jgi:type I restriction enzyme S subunit
MSEVKNIPDGWEETTLGKLVNTNKESIDNKYQFSQIYYLDTGSITEGKIEELQYFELIDAPSRAKRKVKDGDIIYSTVRPNQKHYGFIEKPLNNLIVSTGFTVINSKDINSSKFLYYWITQNTITTYLHQIAEQSASAYPSIKPSDIEKLKIILPKNVEEQKSIAAILTAFDNKIELLQAQNKTLEEANRYFNSNMYCEGADKCAEAYSKLSRKGKQALKDKADMAFKTAECYRYTDRFKDANEWYDRALLLDFQEVNPEIHYYNGEMLRMMGQFEKAQASYDNYKKIVPNDVRGDVGIQSCKDAKSFKANKTRHVVVNQTAINKKEMDMAPMFADRKETKLYFASSRNGSTGGKDPISCESYMDIWVSEIDKKGNWYC